MEINKRYLIKESYTYDTRLSEIEVIQVSQKAFKLKWANCSEWIEKDDFNKKYDIVECLSLNQLGQP